uniref:Uncharacterized protein n=1 Tax=Anopheles albimanus TaxID=7167 RepID=A0A182FBF1_ANOAL
MENCFPGSILALPSSYQAPEISAKVRPGANPKCSGVAAAAAARKYGFSTSSCPPPLPPPPSCRKCKSPEELLSFALGPEESCPCIFQEK